MSAKISVTQVGPLTFQVDAPLTDSLAFVQKALSTVENAVITAATASDIRGDYRYAGGDLLVPFAINFTEIRENAFLVELQFPGDDPEWRTSLIMKKIGKAIYQPYDAEIDLQAKPAETVLSEAPSSLSNPAGPKRSSKSHFERTAFVRKVAPAAAFTSSSDYLTTSAVGSFIAGTGWVGVALSILVGFIVATSEGLLGFLVGFMGIFFCLLTVATGQLLRAQIEIANNSRLILAHLMERESS